MGVRRVYGPAHSQGTVGRGARSPFEAVLITARVIVCVRVPTVVGGAVPLGHFQACRVVA